MLKQLSPDEHERLRPLFNTFDTRLHGCVEAIFSGQFARAWADDEIRPALCAAHLDFWFVAGDAGSPRAAEAVRMAPARVMIVTDGRGAWEQLIRSTLGDDVRRRTRTAFVTPAPAQWDRRRLRAMAADLPAEYVIRRVAHDDVGMFAAIELDLVKNFGSPTRFIEQGVGFGVWHDGRYVAGASSYTLANGKLEVEIATLPEYRRRGLARAVGAALVLHCIDNGIEPSWDAHNPESASLAQQIGFTEPRQYEVFVTDEERCRSLAERRTDPVC